MNLRTAHIGKVREYAEGWLAEPVPMHFIPKRVWNEVGKSLAARFVASGDTELEQRVRARLKDTV